MYCSKCACLTTVLYDSPRGASGVCSACKEEEEHELMMEEAYEEEQAAEAAAWEEDSVEEQEDRMVPPEVRCVVTVGTLQDGTPFLRIDGSNPDLFTAEGLVGYAKRYLERVWELRILQAEKENQPS